MRRRIPIDEKDRVRDGRLMGERLPAGSWPSGRAQAGVGPTQAYLSCAEILRRLELLRRMA
jgi:hypothetical protein